MRYHAVLGGEEQVVEVTPHGSGYRVSIGGRALEVDAVHLQGSALSLIAGTRSVRCDIEPKGEGRLLVLVNENVHELELLDERRLRLRRAAGKFSLEGPQRVDAPMPGKIARVLVAEGQGLVVVEAMKMENELKSPKAGKVTELRAVEGAAVESGAKLAVVT